jgi:hypothetical protein
VRVVRWVALSAVAAGMLWLWLPDSGGHRHGSEERPESLALKRLASAEADFRSNDRDLDGTKQFWRADVAGLYALAPGGGPAIQLIEESLALADDRPLYAQAGRRTRAYRLRAIRHADEDPKALDPNRFAFCAFPDTPKDGKYLFVIDENNTVFRSLAHGRRGVEVFPSEEEMKAEWNKLD